MLKEEAARVRLSTIARELLGPSLAADATMPDAMALFY
jgi:hypothetical protein